MTLFVMALLFADGAWSVPPGGIDSARREVFFILHDPNDQWRVFLFFEVYLIGFSLIRMSSDGFNVRLVAEPVFWFLGVFFSGTLWFYRSRSTEALTFLAGMLIGQATRAWICKTSRNHDSRLVRTSNNFLISSPDVHLVLILITGLAIATVWQVKPVYQYHGQVRLQGPWDNPNEFGMLMGVEVVLVGGLIIRILKCLLLRKEKYDVNINRPLYLPTNDSTSLPPVFLLTIGLVICLLILCISVRGLMLSYSRGAWLATLCGILWLLLTRDSFRVKYLPTVVERFWNIKNISFLILTLGFAINLWNLRKSECYPLHRLSSVATLNDFSGHNRLLMWESALQMIAEHPFGINQKSASEMYVHYYQKLCSEEIGALQLNDYFTLGCNIGLPGLGCFATYLVFLSWKNQNNKIKLSSIHKLYHAGTIVLLVGFVFNAGLLKLPTATIFWILLETGSIYSVDRKAAA